MRFRRVLLALGVLFLIGATAASAQSGWVCVVCGLVSHGGTQASFRTHMCSAHPNAYSGRVAAECGGDIAAGLGIGSGDTTTQIGNAVLGVVGALGSWFDRRAKNMELSAIQRRYVEESRRQAAEAASQQREREEFERTKAAAARSPLAYKAIDVGSAAPPRRLVYKDMTVGTGGSSSLSYKDIIIEDSGHPILSPTIDPRIRRTVNSLFVGGTGVVEGFYVPPGATAAVRATEEQDLRRQLALRGLSPDAIDAYLREYRGFDMMIGLGADPSEPGDLIKRVVGLGTDNDQFSNGAFTASTQPLYASLKGTKTTRLDCHSVTIQGVGRRGSNDAAPCRRRCERMAAVRYTRTLSCCN